MITLTEKQKQVLRWIVQEVRAGRLEEEFLVLWMNGGYELAEYKGDHSRAPDFSVATLDVLEAANMMMGHKHYGRSGGEATRTVTLLGNAYAFVDNETQIYTDEPLRVRLRRALDGRVDKDDINAFCFDLGIDTGNLRGETIRAQIIELIAYVERYNRLDDLLRVIRLARPDLAAELPS